MEKFSKVTGYKINISKSIIFIYLNNEHKKNRTKKIPLTIASRRIYYIESNLTKV